MDRRGNWQKTKGLFQLRTAAGEEISRPKKLPHHPPGDLMTRLGLWGPELIAETSIGLVWKVQTPEGRTAALKLYPPGQFNGESAGFPDLKAAPRKAAVELLRWEEGLALMEWLPGPSLAQCAQDQGLEQADAELLTVAQILQGTDLDPGPMPGLQDRFSALLDFAFAPPGRDAGQDGLLSALEQARQLALELFANPSAQVPLHGDLHHGNVKAADRGFCAFDAKGLYGEACYEMANAFRHPSGMAQEIWQPDVIARRARQWSAGLQVPQDRLLAWAAAKTALSIIWRWPRSGGHDSEEQLLWHLLRIYSERT